MSVELQVAKVRRIVHDDQPFVTIGSRMSREYNIIMDDHVETRRFAAARPITMWLMPDGKVAIRENVTEPVENDQIRFIIGRTVMDALLREPPAEVLRKNLRKGGTLKIKAQGRNLIVQAPCGETRALPLADLRRGLALLIEARNGGSRDSG